MRRYYKGTNKALNWTPIAEDLFPGSIRANQLFASNVPTGTIGFTDDQFIGGSKS